MEFKTLFDILKKHMADGDTVPAFFRELMAMITDVSEDEWGTAKDPSTKHSDETLRTYAKRGMSQTLAKKIVYRLTPDILKERIEEHNETQRQGLADDLIGYDPTVNADNVAEFVSQTMVEIVQRKAGLVPQDKLTKQKQQQQAAELKMKYGDYLLAEENNYCPFPGCGRELIISDAGKTVPTYEVALIDKSKTTDVSNLIALCPQCYATYILDTNKKRCTELKNVKKILDAHKRSVHILDGLPLEKGIVGVVTKISKLKEKDIEDASLNPKELRNKISPDDDLAVYITVRNYVAMYFVKIRDIMTYLDKRGEIDYEEIQDQIHAMYRRLKKANKTKVDIFYEITDKIHRVTLQDDAYCQIVVSYFIQSCEVFDAVTK